MRDAAKERVEQTADALRQAAQKGVEVKLAAMQMARDKTRARATARLARAREAEDRMIALNLTVNELHKKIAELTDQQGPAKIALERQEAMPHMHSSCTTRHGALSLPFAVR
eukprot:749989-Pleurochrysis_carterae.AAC.1